VENISVGHVAAKPSMEENIGNTVRFICWTEMEKKGFDRFAEMCKESLMKTSFEAYRNQERDIWEKLQKEISETPVGNPKLAAICARCHIGHDK
jgi:hypothetical protein